MSALYARMDSDPNRERSEHNPSYLVSFPSYLREGTDNG